METLTNLIKSFYETSVVIALILGVVQCFFGYRLLKFWITVSGFVIGIILGETVSGWFADQAAFQTIIVLGTGILLAVLSFKIYLLGVFLFCGFMAYMAILQIPVSQDGVWKFVLILAALLVGILIGSLAVKFVRPVVIISSSLTGATKVAENLPQVWQHFGKMPEVLTGNNGVVLLLVGVSLAGILFQFLTTKTE